MRPLWKDILVALWLGMLLPGIVLNAFVLKDRYRERRNVTAEEVIEVPEASILVRTLDGVCSDMELNAYLIGVVLAEMPADFHPEALKAQSVAARTYTWKAFTTGGKHGDGSVCTDSTCCQAFISKEDYLCSGGVQENLDKVQSAVNATSSMVLSYEGELIEATYFSSTGGWTESAIAVWGADYPYLQSVSSPERDLKQMTTSFSSEEFQKLLGKSLPYDPQQWFGETSYTTGGGVESIEICGENYTGIQLRSLLGLRSTALQIQTEGDNIDIITYGYGHRVGMSQYGANAMAEEGKNWQQILQHYYPGTTLHPINEVIE